MFTARFEIVVEGEILPEWSPDFGRSIVRRGGGRTTIVTATIDQPALQGLLSRLASARLSLISVGMVDDDHVCGSVERAT
jgi:hypothetical protein